MIPSPSAVSLSLILALPGLAQEPAPQSQPGPAAGPVAIAYADYCHAIYSETLQGAKMLEQRVKVFLEAPSKEGLQAARNAWVAARKVYGRTEVLRFYNGPIDSRRDGPETLLNAWPVDEAYIDYVEGAPESGIIHDTETFPNISAPLLALANERGGEANVSIGWHAVEFLLWGQDLYANGPGRRPHTDYIVGEAKGAERRRQYLATACGLICQHLKQLVDAWHPEAGAYRKEFLAQTEQQAARKILTGMLVLSGFELGGERMAVAYETMDQEDEHSCFSDTSSNDMIANQEGIAAVWHGSHPAMKGVGFRQLAMAADPVATKEVDRLVAVTLKAVRGLPQPFDLALRGGEDSEARKALLTAITSAEDQAGALAAVGLAMGQEIPMRPGG